MKRKMRVIIQRFVAWFVENKCGGCFHNNSYGENGRYIVIMSDDEYHNFQWNVKR